MAERQEKVSGIIKEIAASHIGRETNKTSVITVTDASISSDLKRATIYITVLPEEKEEFALNFVRRNLGRIRDELKRGLNTKFLPFLDVKVDKGEKARQTIERLLRE